MVYQKWLSMCSMITTKRGGAKIQLQDQAETLPVSNDNPSIIFQKSDPRASKASLSQVYSYQ